MEYIESHYPAQFKRYCKTLTLQDDAALVEQYKQAHGPKAVWPEINQGMREVGILKMEIYLLGRQLFMIMDTTADFDHDQAMAELASKPRQSEWETYVSQFQKTTASSTANEKWQLMERIYELS
ncbi:L-rhamnose mutarotase [Hymenobacter crusticola]|uniref:L-rhamnose mutarotase n=1 Tax=Hymenobacter crusticola TaxID=1770526 RepID=A0A243WFE9_9BACT|nr:L-rhamnose mutarotase [Hymenobacter crusticola]OUJ74189.1 L-rhamnose mutarotase [Hymenobacter crusticola]